MTTEFPTNDIEEYSWYVGFNSMPERERRPTYFHYTNLDNRNFIVKDNCIDLRLTRADCFTDKEEISHVIPVFLEACTELLHNGTIDIEFYNEVTCCVSEAKSIVEEHRKYYIFCFSANGNSSYLKENYARRNKKDGVIIGFRGLALEEIGLTVINDQEEISDGIYLRDVLYDNDAIKCGFSKILSKLFKLRNQSSNSYKAVQRTIRSLISEYSLVYKPPAFTEEEETRLIVDLSKLTIPDNQFYQKDNRYLHITLPQDAFFEEEIVLN